MTGYKEYHEPELHHSTLVMGMNGWMDGGEVSTGTVDYLRVKLMAIPFAEICPEGYYLLSFPGSMELASMIRPNVKFQDGMILSYDYPDNKFYEQSESRIILFSGWEPNLNWEGFSDIFFNLIAKYNIQKIIFIGSVSGLIPHSRETRISCAMSNIALRKTLDKFGFKFTDYEGPSSFITYLLGQCSQRNIDMITLTAEVPAYLQGYNPKCVEVAVRCISSLLELQLQCDDLRMLGDEFEKRVSLLVEEQPELKERVHQLESIYDNEIFDSEMGDLKTWLQRRGINLD